MNGLETVYHVPVMLVPSVDGLNIRKSGVYADMTFGGEDIRAKYCGEWTPEVVCSASTRTATL